MKKLLLFLFFSTVCFAQSSITASNTVGIFRRRCNALP